MQNKINRREERGLNDKQKRRKSKMGVKYKCINKGQPLFYCTTNGHRQKQHNTYVGIVKQVIIVAVVPGGWLGSESHLGHRRALIGGVVLVDNRLHL